MHMLLLCIVYLGRIEQVSALFVSIWWHDGLHMVVARTSAQEKWRQIQWYATKRAIFWHPNHRRSTEIHRLGIHQEDIQSCGGFDTGLVPISPLFCFEGRSCDENLVWNFETMPSFSGSFVDERNSPTPPSLDTNIRRILEVIECCQTRFGSLVPAHFLLKFLQFHRELAAMGCASCLISRVEGTKLFGFFAASSTNNTIETFRGWCGRCSPSCGGRVGLGYSNSYVNVCMSLFTFEADFVRWICHSP